VVCGIYENVGVTEVAALAPSSFGVLQALAAFIPRDLSRHPEMP